jgi:hypothetical protein
MPENTREGTDMLKEIADEVVQQREERGASEFDVHATQENSEDSGAVASESDRSYEERVEDAPLGSASRIARQNSPQ